MPATSGMDMQLYRACLAYSDRKTRLARSNKTIECGKHSTRHYFNNSTIAARLLFHRCRNILQPAPSPSWRLILVPACSASKSLAPKLPGLVPFFSRARAVCISWYILLRNQTRIKGEIQNFDMASCLFRKSHPIQVNRVLP